MQKYRTRALRRKNCIFDAEENGYDKGHCVCLVYNDKFYEHLTVKSIAVQIIPTTINGNGHRSIVLREPLDKFYLVMTNFGKETIRVWQEDNSWGY
jgi:hypothetical protein